MDGYFLDLKAFFGWDDDCGGAGFFPVRFCFFFCVQLGDQVLEFMAEADGAGCRVVFDDAVFGYCFAVTH